MKSRLMSHGLLAAALFLAVPAMASTTWYVNGVNGSDKNNCNTPQTACKTIGHAISLASSGDSIKVAAGIYKETLTINSSLKLIGADTSTTIVDGSGYGNVVYVAIASAHVRLSKVTVRNGGQAGCGAGILNYGTLTVSESMVEGNSAEQGGGICNVSTMTLNHSTLRRNSASGIDGYYSAAGGIDNGGTLTVNDSTISENTALGDYVCGGGIYNAGTLTINNSTLYRNYTNGDSSSVGGGIDNEGGTVALNNSTLSGNKATAGGTSGGGISNGGCARNRSYPSTITLQNTIVANSRHGGNCSGTMTSMGYNLSSDRTCNFNGTGDLNNTVPKLGKLGNYGGPTQTIPLLQGSPAIDTGNPNGCTDGQGHLLKTDQRGKPRPDREDNGIGCDMGAYERQSD